MTAFYRPVSGKPLITFLSLNMFTKVGSPPRANVVSLFLGFKSHRILFPNKE